MSRRRPIITDRERLAAARLAAERLRETIPDAGGWWHFMDSAGGIYSQNPERELEAQAGGPTGQIEEE